MTPTPPRVHRTRRGTTLVEVMLSGVIFVVAVLGTYGLFLFSIRNMDQSRSLTQATQILTHEMESIRMRTWDTQTSNPIPPLKSIRALAGASVTYGTFVPFADYSKGDDAVIALGTAGAVLDDTAMTVQYRNATGTAAGFTCTRTFVPKNSVTGATVALASADMVEITLTVQWQDSRKIDHTRRFISTVSKNGINDSIFNTEAL